MTTEAEERRVARAVKLEIARQWGVSFVAGDNSSRVDALLVARAAISEMNKMAEEKSGGTGAI